MATTEIFGPVFGLMQVDTVEDAIALVNSGRYGNMACLFTTDGRAARQFRYAADVGNIGINIGVAAPMAYFPFSGWRSSFFGVLHGQGKHAVEFFTQTKVVVNAGPPTGRANSELNSPLQFGGEALSERIDSGQKPIRAPHACRRFGRGNRLEVAVVDVAALRHQRLEVLGDADR